MSNLAAKTKAVIRAFSTEQTEVHPMMIVYKMPNGDWRGFVNPYGETTEAPTKKEAISKLKDLTEAYKSIVESYNNPAHLVYCGLNNNLDLKVFHFVFSKDEIVNKIQTSGKFSNDDLYVETYRN